MVQVHHRHYLQKILQQTNQKYCWSINVMYMYFLLFLCIQRSVSNNLNLHEGLPHFDQYSNSTVKKQVLNEIVSRIESYLSQPTVILLYCTCVNIRVRFVQIFTQSPDTDVH